MISSEENFHLSFSQEKGYSAIAPHEMKKGDLALIEKPLAYSIISSENQRRCHNCFKVCEPSKLLQCSQCKWTKYCSPECQKSHWKQGRHKLECQILKSTHHASLRESMLLSLRLILYLKSETQTSNNTEILPFSTKVNDRSCPSKEEIDKFNSQSLPRKIKHQVSDVLRLISHRDKQSEMGLHLISSVASMILSIMNYDSEKSAFHMKECNVLEEIVELILRQKYNGINICDEDLKGIATSLFPRLSFFNHSCCPNCVPSFDSFGTLYVRTIRKVNEGEELSIGYIDNGLGLITRQALLSEGWLFCCECERCQNEMKTTEFDEELELKADAKDEISSDTAIERQKTETEEKETLERKDENETKLRVFLSSFVCSCGGTLFPLYVKHSAVGNASNESEPTQKDETKEAETSSSSSQPSSSSTASSSPTAASSIDSLMASLPSIQTFSCNKCHKTLSRAELTELSKHTSVIDGESMRAKNETNPKVAAATTARVIQMMTSTKKTTISQEKSSNTPSNDTPSEAEDSKKEEIEFIIPKYHPYNGHLIQEELRLFHLYIDLSRFENALALGEKLLNKLIYAQGGVTSPIVGLHYAALAKLDMLFSHQKEAFEYFKKAASILAVTHPPFSVYLREILENIKDAKAAGL